jgi:uncharacterized protein (DUF1501 family)
MRMQRRDFLGLAGASVALAPVPAAWAFSSDAYRRVLVLVELKGGNDGLNTVVPFADGNYYRLRPRIAIRRDEVLQLSERAGLHPSLAALMPLWQSRELAVIQGLGYPKPNQSHFRSIEIWDTASGSEQYLHEGWLARAFADNPVPRGFVADGVVVGSQEMGPFAGGARAVALNNTEQFMRQSRLATPSAKLGNAALAHILRVEGEIVQAAGNLGSGVSLKTEFPTGEFGNALRTASQVIASQAGVAAVRVTLNGFDTHQNQPGQQANLLKQLGEGLSALKAALIELNRWNSALVMTYAEFGRRAAENNSNGTDHGTANAHFAMGGQVRGGLYGEGPALDRLENGNLAHSVDFRSLYATVLEKWWGADAKATLGGRFQAMDLLKS